MFNNLKEICILLKLHFFLWITCSPSSYPSIPFPSACSYSPKNIWIGDLTLLYAVSPSAPFSPLYVMLLYFSFWVVYTFIKLCGFWVLLFWLERPSLLQVIDNWLLLSPGIVTDFFFEVWMFYLLIFFFSDEDTHFCFPQELFKCSNTILKRVHSFPICKFLNDFRPTFGICVLFL